MADSLFDDNDVFSTPFAQPLSSNDGDHGNGNDHHRHEEESDTESEPATTPPSLPTPSTTLLIAHEPPQPLCGCNISRAILQDNVLIAITSAVKNSENVGSSASYVMYNIKFADKEAKRRYSEFDSLRTSLARLYPTVIVPPIPEKHSLTDYATMQPNRVKVDVIMIDKRKRMLQSFLNRVAHHPILGAEHVFHRFLDSNTSWSEVLHSPPLSTLPKNPLQQLPKSGEPSSPTSSTAPPTPSSATSTSTSSVIPIPSSSHVLKHPDPRFADSEVFTNKFSQHISTSVDKAQRKVIRRLSDLANDYAELGAVYNGFSLNENSDLANAIEKVGQAVDSSFTLTGQMITSLESHFAEPIQEYTQFAQIIKQVLKYRHLKHAQAELIADTLESKKASLEQMLKLEADAKRLEDALHRGAGGGRSPRPSTNDILENASNDEADGAGDQGPYSSTNTPERRASDNSHQENPYASTYSSANGVPKSRQRSWSTPKMNIVSALSHTVQGFLDVDPEATRRNNIGKTKDVIVQLEEAKQLTSADLITISMSIQVDLDRFQRQKVKDIRDLLVAYAKIHLKWCQKNLGSWQEAKAEVEKIEV